MIVVQEQPVFRRYLAPLISLSSVFQLACVAASIAIPFIISFSTSGLWLKFHVIEQQPLITAAQPILLMLQVNDSYVAYRAIQSAPDANNRVFSLTTTQTDTNADRIVDMLSFHFEAPKEANEQIFGVQLFIPHSCQLHDPLRFQFDSLLMFQHSTGVASTRLTLDGTLRVVAREPIETWRAPASDLSGDKFAQIWADAQNDAELTTTGLPRVIALVESQNLKTHYHVAYPSWRLDETFPNTTFVIDMLVRVPRDMLPYRPGVGEVCKWAYMQWIAFFFPVWLIIRAIKRLAFQYNMLGSIPAPLETDLVTSSSYMSLKQ